MTHDVKDESKPINAKIGKQRFGAIQKNQRWMKRDTKRVMTIAGKKPNGSYAVIFDGDRGTKTHTLKQEAIYRYYVPCA